MRNRVIAAFFVILVSAARPCVLLPTVYKVARNFQVSVADRGKPLRGMRLKVTLTNEDRLAKAGQDALLDRHSTGFEEETVATAVTDEYGLATFALSQDGLFSLESQVPGILWTQVDVSRSHGTSDKIELNWPTSQVIASSALRGQILTGLGGEKLHPLRHRKLALIEAFTRKEIEITETDDQGNFLFKIPVKGLHFIHILPNGKSAWSVEGDVAVDSQPDARSHRIDISVAGTSCGLTYDLTANKNRYKPLGCIKGDGSPCKE